MNSQALQLIKDSKSELEVIISDIINIENALAQSAYNEIQTTNTAQLSNLVDLKGKLLTVTNKSDFDSLLHTVQKCENTIDGVSITLTHIHE
jgi:hypothetical protein